MKKLFLTLFVVLTTLMCFSQKKTTDASQAARKAEAESLKSQARGANTLGIVSVSVGGATALTGIYIMLDGLYGDLFKSNADQVDWEVDGNRVLLGGVVTLVGVGVAVVGGTIFFNKARKLKREARIKLRSTSIMMPKMNNSYTAVNMKAIPQLQLTYTIPL